MASAAEWAGAAGSVRVNADHWKTWVHQRLSTPIEKPGSMTLFKAQPNEHISLAKHLTAEVKTGRASWSR